MAEQVSAKLSVASASGAGNKGSYVEALSSTNFVSQWLEIVLVATGEHPAKVNIDVAIGASMSEVDKIIEFPFLATGTSGGGVPYSKISIPFQFATGGRLAVRVCDTDGSVISYTVTIRILTY